MGNFWTSPWKGKGKGMTQQRVGLQVGIFILYWLVRFGVFVLIFDACDDWEKLHVSVIMLYCEWSVTKNQLLIAASDFRCSLESFHHTNVYLRVNIHSKHIHCYWKVLLIVWYTDLGMLEKYRLD